MIGGMRAHKEKGRFPWKGILLVMVALFLLLIGAVLVWASFVKLPDLSTFENWQNCVV
jgi:hypothetical protein